MIVVKNVILNRRWIQIQIQIQIIGSDPGFQIK